MSQGSRTPAFLAFWRPAAGASLPLGRSGSALKTLPSPLTGFLFQLSYPLPAGSGGHSGN